MTRPGEWTDHALCAETDPDLFTSDGQGSNNSTRAKRIRARCPVVAECLAYALATHQEGTWGGTTDRERQKMRRNTA